VTSIILEMYMSYTTSHFEMSDKVLFEHQITYRLDRYTLRILLDLPLEILHDFHYSKQLYKINWNL